MQLYDTKLDKWQLSPTDDVIRKVALWILPVFIFTALTALGAQIAIPVPGSPVPVTLQTLFVLLSGGWLGATRGALSQFLYVLIGALGMPVFAGHTAGFSVLMGPTAGYLIGFMLASLSVGLWTKGQKSLGRQMIRLWLSGSLVIFGCGLLNLVYVHSIPWSKALEIGFYPYIIGDVLKILFAASILKFRIRN